MRLHWALLLMIGWIVACSPDPQPIRAARYLVDGLAENDQSRIQKGLCRSVQNNTDLMTVGPLMAAYRDGTLPNFERRGIKYKVLHAETFEAVVEVVIPNQPNYYLLSTVEERGWCICGDMTANEWNDNPVRGEAIHRCRPSQVR